MDTEEVNQALQLFDTSEKWDAFIRLSQQADNLKRAMTRTAVSRANSYFQREHTAPGWSFKQFGPDEFAMVWFLTAYGEYSICLVLSWSGVFVLEVRGSNVNDVEAATQLLKESKFSALMTCFERVDEWWEGRFMGKEKFNFRFGSPSDTHFGPFRLAWHAHFETEKLLDQIGTKVARFQTQEMTALLTELNELTRKT
ncbi:MAG: hypothetical protein ACRYG7_39495 [Janthinobacterium lividum]